MVMVIGVVVAFVPLRVLSATIETTRPQQSDSLHRGFESLYTAIANSFDGVWNLIGFASFILTVLIVTLYPIVSGR